MRQFLTWAASEGEQVLAKPQLPKLPRLHKDALSLDDLAAMEAAAPAERDNIIIRLFADCGLRLSELMALKVGNIVRSGRQAMLAVEGKAVEGKGVGSVGYPFRPASSGAWRGTSPAYRKTDARTVCSSLCGALPWVTTNPWASPGSSNSSTTRRGAPGSAGPCIPTCYGTRG